MAKTNHFLIEYKQCIGKAKIDFKNVKPPKKTMHRLLRLFESVDDPRLKARTDYPLEEIIVIAFLAVLGNACGWNQIESFGKAHIKWLTKILKLKNGIPSHDTFRKVFSIINHEQLQAATVIFISENLEKIKKSMRIKTTDKRHICVDGKESRGSGRKSNTSEEVKNLRTLHVFDETNGICLYSEPIDSKTNEIPVAQKLLSCMDLSDSIVTFDSMNTQKKTIEVIIDQKGDYVGALKGNHEVFEREVKDFFTDAEKESIKKKVVFFITTTEKAHNSIETRVFYLTTNIAWFQDLSLWKGLKSFICYDKKTVNLVTKKETFESRYYISSLTDPELCADSIRQHWGIEVKLHWQLDKNFLEDQNTTMDKFASNNLSIINKMVLSIFKLAQPVFGNASIRSLRKIFGWSLEESLAKILNFFSEEDLYLAIATAKDKKFPGIKMEKPEMEEPEEDFD